MMQFIRGTVAMHGDWVTGQSVLPSAHDFYSSPSSSSAAAFPVFGTFDAWIPNSYGKADAANEQTD